MLSRLAGFGFLLLTLALPLQADHWRQRSRRHYRGYSYAPAYVEVYVATPRGHGVFVRRLRVAPPYPGYGYYPDTGWGFQQSRHKRRHYFKRHRHFHYDNYCPY
jgi:hypothetical protein